jgi:hypothetical protein
VYDGVHSTELRGERVACGATAPRNNSPLSARPSVSPRAFVRALKAAGLDRFDAYDHHPYARGEAPGAPPAGHSQITLANIDDLTDEIARLWGPERLWIGEYGYETNQRKPAGWQSGFLTATGRPKPAFAAFQRLHAEIS